MIFGNKTLKMCNATRSEHTVDNVIGTQTSRMHHIAAIARTEHLKCVIYYMCIPHTDCIHQVYRSTLCIRCKRTLVASSLADVISFCSLTSSASRSAASLSKAACTLAASPLLLLLLPPVRASAAASCFSATSARSRAALAAPCYTVKIHDVTVGHTCMWSVEAVAEAP
jgi:hypothetical protein